MKKTDLSRYGLAIAFSFFASAVSHAQSCPAPSVESLDDADKAALESKIQSFVAEKKSQGYTIDEVEGPWEKVEQVEDQPAGTKVVKERVKVGEKKNVRWIKGKFQLFRGTGLHVTRGSTCSPRTRAAGPKFDPEIRFPKRVVTQKGIYETRTKEVSVEATYKEVRHYFAEITYHKEPEIQVRMMEEQIPPTTTEPRTTPGTQKKVTPSAGKSKSSKGTPSSTQGRQTPGGSTKGSSKKTYEVNRNGAWVKVSESEYKELISKGAKPVQ